MYIGFDECPLCNGATSEMFETNVNANVQCDHGYAYSSNKDKPCTRIIEEIWDVTKNIFLVLSK